MPEIEDIGTIEDDTGEDSLETTVEKTYTTRQKVWQGIRGYGIPIIGGVAGYFAADGPGGFGIGMTLTSFGIAMLESDECPELTISGYRVGFVVGAVMSVISCVHYNMTHVK